MSDKKKSRLSDTANKEIIFSNKKLSKMSKKELSSHLAALNTYRAKQSLEQVFPCVKCDRSLAFKSDFETHSETCRGFKPRPIKVEADHPSLDLDRLIFRINGKRIFSCQLCQYKSEHTTSMKNHLTVHSGLKPHKCEVCGKSFSTVCYLTTHKRIHSGIKRYKCQECEYSCNTACNMKRHEVSHGGGTLFACPECNFKTTYSSSLARHKRSHLKIMLFHCSMCPFESVTSHELTVHTRAHTGERPFRCDLCGYGCITKSHLIKHRKIHHAEVARPGLSDKSDKTKSS